MNDQPRRWKAAIEVDFDFLRDLKPLLQSQVTPVLEEYIAAQTAAWELEQDAGHQAPVVPNVDTAGTGSSTGWHVAITENPYPNRNTDTKEQ